VREQVAALGLESRVRFLGVRADVADILRASDMFVLSSRVEGNPLSVMEAMAAGLPVVSTAVGGVPELVREGETGLLVPSEDAGALARAVQVLVDDPVRRQAMGAAARQYAVWRASTSATPCVGMSNCMSRCSTGANTDRRTKVHKKRQLTTPLLQVPPARRGNRTLARFPSRSGGNLRRGAIVNFDGVVGKCLCVGFSTCPPPNLPCGRGRSCDSLPACGEG
jgi:hypothetical protein